MSNTRAPLVSIITPTFNHERYIGPCIESVLAQTYQNWEQIIIDDGSTDNTAAIIQSLADSRIRYIYQKNQGIEALAHTYNRMLSICRGEFIAILEGDDIWPAGKLTSLIPAFTDPNVVLAYGAVADIASDGTWHGRLSHSVRKNMRLSKDILTNTPVGVTTNFMLRADGVDLVPPSTVVIRRSVLNAIGGFQYFPELSVTDFPTFLSLTQKGKFYYTSEVMGCRRRHLGSATFKNLTKILTQAHRYVEFFIRKHSLQLASSEQQSIEKSWTRPKAGVEFTAGRLELLNNDWEKARRHFARALNPSMPHIFLTALVGWLFSWIQFDLETVLRFCGVASLKAEK